MPRVQNLRRCLHDPEGGHPLKSRAQGFLPLCGRGVGWALQLQLGGLRLTPLTLDSALLGMSEWDGPSQATRPGLLDQVQCSPEDSAPCCPCSLYQLLAAVCPGLASPKGAPVLVDPSVDPFELCLFFWGISSFPLPICCPCQEPEEEKGAGLGWAYGLTLPCGIESEAFCICICPQGCLPPGDTAASAGRALAQPRWLKVVGRRGNRGQHRAAPCLSHQVAMTGLWQDSQMEGRLEAICLSLA